MGNQYSEPYSGSNYANAYGAATTMETESAGAAFRCALNGGANPCSRSVLNYPTPNIRDLYLIGRRLGEGQFGTTYLCSELSTGVEFACKTIPKCKLGSTADLEDVRREIEILYRLSGNADVVQIKGVYEDPVAVHIVMEFCAGGELYDRVLLRKRYSERNAAMVVKTIVGFVKTCHDMEVMHRDLKLENFLLVDKEDDLSIKAIDFGLSVYFKPGQIFHDLVGSPYYMAPEVVNKRYGPEADVWSVGVILYILLSGVPPFWAETQKGIFDAILEGHIDFTSDPWPSVSDRAKDLIRKMLCRDPAERLALHQILCHPWFSGNGVAAEQVSDLAPFPRFNHFSSNKSNKVTPLGMAENLSKDEIAHLQQMLDNMTSDDANGVQREFDPVMKDVEIRDFLEVSVPIEC